MRMTAFVLTATLGIFTQAAHAQVRTSGYDLPVALAGEAAAEAIRACEANGYKVSAAVVHQSGEKRALPQGDYSTTHPRKTSFRQAYTVAKLGPEIGSEN